MEHLRSKVLLAVLALAVAFGTASVAMAQVVYQVTTTPTFVINTGRAEVMGNVRITNTNGVATISGTIEYLFQGVGCDLTTTTAINLVKTGAYNIAGVVIASTTNTTAGCVVAVTVPLIGATAAGDYLELQGVRGRVDIFSGGISSVGVNIFASLSATPSNSSLFTVPNAGVVGITNVGLEVVSVVAGSVLQCLGGPANSTITVREGFNGAFVQHLAVVAPATVAPVNFRPAFGAAAPGNTQVRFVTAGAPATMTLTWPATVTGSIGALVAGVSGSALLRQTTATATSQTYEYACGDQAVCDVSQESFAVTAVLTVGATTPAGSATIQTRLFPDLITGDATTVTSALGAAGIARPRFNDPLRPTPATVFATNALCRTNLLWPFVVQDVFPPLPATAAANRFITGFALANTGRDNPAFVSGATDFGALAPPAGTCTWYAFRQFPTPPGTGTADAGPAPAVLSITRGPITAGDTDILLASDVVGTANLPWLGYMITTCNFQFGHGFAFVAHNPTGTAFTVSHGYLALIIPDPVVNAGRRGSDSSFSAAQGGEGLNE